MILVEHLFQNSDLQCRNGQFQATSGIAVSGGNIFVSDNGNDRVQIFNMSGEYLSQIGVTVTTDGKFYYPIGVDTNSRRDNSIG